MEFGLYSCACAELWDGKCVAFGVDIRNGWKKY